MPGSSCSVCQPLVQLGHCDRCPLRVFPRSLRHPVQGSVLPRRVHGPCSSYAACAADLEQPCSSQYAPAHPSDRHGQPNLRSFPTYPTSTAKTSGTYERISETGITRHAVSSRFVCRSCVLACPICPTCAPSHHCAPVDLAQLPLLTRLTLGPCV
jgi:hypothetical protein